MTDPGRRKYFTLPNWNIKLYGTRLPAASISHEPHVRLLLGEHNSWQRYKCYNPQRQSDMCRPVKRWGKSCLSSPQPQTPQHTVAGDVTMQRPGPPGFWSGRICSSELFLKQSVKFTILGRTTLSCSMLTIATGGKKTGWEDMSGVK